jgi:hypothetical protein
MKSEGIEVKRFIRWYLRQLCQHDADSCIMELDTIVCLRCQLRMKVPVSMAAEYNKLPTMD